MPLTFPPNNFFQPGQLFSSAKKMTTLSHPHWAQMRVKPEQDISLFVFTLTDYKKNVIAAIKKKFKDHTVLSTYLVNLVEYTAGNTNVTSTNLAKDFDAVVGAYKTVPKNQITGKLEPNFGEILAPIFAARWVKPFIDKPNVAASGNNLTAAYGNVGNALKYIIFPDVQNYPLFDFFITDGYIFGFSVKGEGSSNPLGSSAYAKRLTPEYIATVSQKMKNFSTVYKNEISFMLMLGGASQTEGPILALGRTLEKFAGAYSPLKESRKYKVSLKDTFKGINTAGFERIAKAMGSITAKSSISKVQLNDNERAACINFLLYFSLGRSAKSVEFDKYKKNPNLFIVDHFVSGCIQYVCDIPIPKITELTRLMFPDLNIVKIKLKSNGVPEYTLQEHHNIGQKLAKALKEDVQQIKLGKDYAFRSKASFGRVKDKLGVQL